MTPAFDAAMAECARLRLRWRIDDLGMSVGIGQNSYGFIAPEATPEEAVTLCRIVLAQRCEKHRFRKVVP